MKKIHLERTPEQVDLIKSMASRNPFEAFEAQSAFAALISGVAQEVIQQAPTIAAWFDTMGFERGTDQSIPLDKFWDLEEDRYVNVWSKTFPEGAATNQTHGVHRMQFSMFDMESRLQIDAQTAADAQLDWVSKDVNRMIQEHLLKQQDFAADVFIGALANSETKDLRHVIRANTEGEFLLADFNKLATRATRIRPSWVGGTPSGTAGARGFTNMAISPELVEEIRNFPFNPLNTRRADDSIEGHDQLRQDIFSSSGIPNLYGIDILQLHELGVGQRYNKVFDVQSGAIEYDDEAFDEDHEEIVLAIDTGVGGFIRAVETNGYENSEFVVEPVWGSGNNLDKKIAFQGRNRENYLGVDVRAATGVIVNKGTSE